MRGGTWKKLLALGVGLLVPAGASAASIESELAFHRGVAAYEAGRLDEARGQFERVLAEDPEDATAIQYLGLIAQAVGNSAEAIERYRRAITLAPESADLRFDLGTALLEAGRAEEARGVFDEVLAREPARARAHLFAGIADYRLRNFSDAIGHVEKAMELDPELRLQGRYYTGLAQAFLGDYAAAAGAFALVEEQSPVHPLGRSAAQLREQVTPPRPERPWTLALTSGMEWDSNPIVVGEDQRRSPDFRGILRLRGSYRLVESEWFRLRAGYDGFGSLHVDENEVNLQTHLGWASASARVDRVALQLRYDFSYTHLEFDDDFTRLHRLTPSITIREGQWGISQFYYQYQDVDFLRPSPFLFALPAGIEPDALDRDGQQHSWAVNQFVFVADPLHYLRVGVLADRFDPQGTEFRYDGYELSAGLALGLPWGITFTTDYRYVRRDYRNESFFDPLEERDDRIHRVTGELVRPIGGNFELSIAGTFRDNDSDVPTFDYDRVVAGTYVTYRF